MSYSVNPSVFKSIFVLPTDIIDKHIRLANEHQLKVLLWIFRTSPDSPDIGEMCKALKINEADANDYLQYWVQNGILNCDKDVIVSVSPAEPEENPKEIEEKAVKSKKSSVSEELPLPSKPTSAEILTRLEESPEIGHLFTEAQIKLGKTIGYDGQCTLLLIHDHYGLPVEVIFMMIDYCVSVGKTNYNYLQTVGKDWGTREIDTLEKAAEQITILRNTNSTWKEFAKAVGLSSTRPTTKQIELIRRWTEDFKFDFEMIMYAYETMMNTKGIYQIDYLNGILVSWHEQKYKNPAEVEKAKKEFRESKESKKSQKKQTTSVAASYDLDEFKERSLHSELKYERKKKKDELQ